MTSTGSIENLAQLLQGRPAKDGGPAQGGFAALMQAATGAATGQGSAGTLADGADASGAAGASGGGLAGLSLKGASGAELLALKLQLATGLKGLETEIGKAVQKALAHGDTQQAQAIVTGAAQALGAILGQADRELGTNMLALLRKRFEALTAGTDGEGAGAPGTADTGGTVSGDASGAVVKRGPEDPLAQVEAFFSGVFNALGLARPVQSAAGGAEGIAAAPVASPPPGGAIHDAVPDGRSGGAEAPGAAGARGLAEVLQDLSAAAGGATKGAAGAKDAPASGAAAEASTALPRVLQSLLDGASAGGGDRKDAPASAADALGVVTAARHANPVSQAVPAAAQPVANSAADASQTARFSGLVTGQIKSASFTGDQTRIELEPRGLGAVEIDLKRGDGGKMQVVVRAENPMVLAALRNDKETLANILSGSGFASSGSTLDFQDLGGRGERQNGRGLRARGGLAALGEDEGETVAGWQPTIGQGRLDIRT